MDNSDEDGINFDDLFNKMEIGAQPSSLRDILDDDDIAYFIELDPINVSSNFASLLLAPELQSNSYRIEVLVHQSLSVAHGQQLITPNNIQKYFEALNTTFCAYNEDPAESLFTNVVHDEESSYIIFEGLWEYSCFQLQRFINLVDSLPKNNSYQQIKNSVKAALKLSNELAKRAGLERYLLGNTSPLNSLDDDLLKEALDGNRVKFTLYQLEELGISELDLRPFIFDLAEKENLQYAHLGNSPLERKPIVKSNDEYYVLLPSSLSAAIRVYLIELSINNGMYDALYASIYNNYINLFSEEIRIFGEVGPLPFQRFKNKHGNIVGADSLVSIDAGRFFHFILLFDDFDNYGESYFNGYSPNFKGNSQAVVKRIEKAQKFASNQNDFRGGYSLVVLCGWGRPVALSFDRPQINYWRIEDISAEDLITLSLDPDMSSLSFWRFLEAKEKLDNIGVELLNINGLLNLYAWAKINNYHLVPHEDIPEKIKVSDLNQFMMVVDQNAIVQIRSNIMKAWDEHVVVNPDGESVRVKKISIKQYYSEDKELPIYISIDNLLEGGLLSLVYGENIKWWSRPIIKNNSDRNFVYQIFDAIGRWIHKLDSKTEYFGIQQILWKFDFLDNKFLSEPPHHVPVFEELKKYIQVESNLENGILRIKSIFNEGFVISFHQENNDAEKAIIYSLVLGITNILGDSDKIERIIDSVFVNADAKSIHMLKAQHFIDYVRDSLPKPLFFDRFDDATSRVGFGWLCRSPKDGNNIDGISECLSYLRLLVDSAWDRLKSILCTLDKESTLKFLLLNHESVENESMQWKQTSTHALALHNNKEDVLRVISEQVALRNLGTLASRLAAEMALSECQKEGGLIAGQLDITKILTYAASLFHIGNWSDAIRFEMIPPRIRISQLGEVMFDQSFNNKVVGEYGMLSQQALIVSESKNYKKHFSNPQTYQSTIDSFEQDFLTAWVEEYGFSIDEGRSVIDLLEDYGIKECHSAVYIISKQKLNELVENASIPLRVLDDFLISMVLKNRGMWLNIPEGYNENDIRPWKFKRRLSLISRPIIEISENEYMVAPCLIRKGFIYLVRNCYEASFDENHFFRKKMQKWVGKERNRIGHQFNKDVANEFLRYGWNAESDVKLTKLLNTKLDKDYGDIDVIAWNDRKSQVYLIECKKLEFAKTPGEIARQIYDFRGVLRDDGKPDRLYKHLQRIKVINQNLDRLAQYLKLQMQIKTVPSILFSGIVPMSFVDSYPLNQVSVMSFDDIENVTSQVAS